MKDYSSISSQVIDIMNKIKEFDDISYEDLNDDDKLIHSKIKKVIPEFQKYIIENPLTAQYFINDQFNQLYTPHFIGINHLDNLLSDIEINDDDYMNIITELYTLKLIRNVHTIFWCENCRDEQQFLQSFSNTDPNHSTLECPKCKSDMFCSSIYELHQILLL